MRLQKKFQLFLRQFKGFKIAQRNQFASLFNTRIGFFLFTLLVCFSLGAFYPVILLVTFDYHNAWIFFKHNPNYSIFVLMIFPLAAGLFFVLMKDFKGNKIPTLWKVWLFIGAIPIMILVSGDVLFKGPPIQPTHLKMTNYQKDLILKVEKKERAKYWESNQTNPNKYRQIYIEQSIKILGINEERILGFVDFRDFFERASIIAIYDALISFISAAFIVLVVWFFAYLQLKKVEVDDRCKDALTWVYMLLALWIPCRLYSLWYQNFYTFTNQGEIFFLTLFLGYTGLFYLASLYAKGVLAKTVAIFQTVAASIIGIVVFFKPTLFVKFIGETARDMSWPFLASVEVVLLTLLVSAIWPFLEDNSTVDSSDE